MKKHARKSESEPNGNGRLSDLKTDIEVVRVQLSGLEKTVNESRDETRRWRDEMKSDALTLATSFLTRMDKHDTMDENTHSIFRASVARLENQSLEAGKMMIGRIETLEKTEAAVSAVSSYQRWLLTSIVIAGAALLLNAIRLFSPIWTAFGIGG